MSWSYNSDSFSKMSVIFSNHAKNTIETVIPAKKFSNKKFENVGAGTFISVDTN